MGMRVRCHCHPWSHASLGSGVAPASDWFGCRQWRCFKPPESSNIATCQKLRYARGLGEEERVRRRREERRCNGYRSD
eukprot:4519319-Pyramimonas_sp.AAC.1